MDAVALLCIPAGLVLPLVLGLSGSIAFPLRACIWGVGAILSVPRSQPDSLRWLRLVAFYANGLLALLTILATLVASIVAH